MEISTFELLFKPQSPSAPAGVTEVDRVIQGYFLTITNLEDEEYRYGLEFIISPPPAGTPDQAFRTLTGNTLVFVDTPGTDNQSGILNSAGSSQSIFRPSTGFITIPARGTALVAVLPSAFGPNPLDPTPLTELLFEVRGYVRLTLPALFNFSGLIPSFRREPQSDRPVNVLVTPQHRATFLTASGDISDQIQATLPVASGQAANEIQPAPGGPLVITPPILERELIVSLNTLQDNPDMNNNTILAALIAQLDGENESLEEFNAALAELNIPYSIGKKEE